MARKGTSKKIKSKVDELAARAKQSCLLFSHDGTRVSFMTPTTPDHQYISFSPFFDEDEIGLDHAAEWLDKKTGKVI
jgi:hypothetical protein